MTDFSSTSSSLYIPVENIYDKVSDELGRLLRGVIKIEEFLKNNPPRAEYIQTYNTNNNITTDNVNFYLPNFEDEPPIKRRRLNTDE